MANSTIEWTQMTWNPTTGCNKISDGCKFCYAEIMSRRLKAMGQEKYKDGFELKIHPNTLTIPYTWTKPKIVFVNSMSDLFHKNVPTEFILQVFKVMNENPKHIFQLLTKRPERLTELNSIVNWSKNIWMGVTVENEKVKARIDYLRNCNASIKFLSIEPFIGPLLKLNLSNIDWVIVGGESGHNPRKMEELWLQNILTQCDNSKVAFFFKQWGGKNKKNAGRLLNGRTYDAMPKINLS